MLEEVNLKERKLRVFSSWFLEIEAMIFRFFQHLLSTYYMLITILSTFTCSISVNMLVYSFCYQIYSEHLFCTMPYSYNKKQYIFSHPYRACRLVGKPDIKQVSIIQYTESHNRHYWTLILMYMGSSLHWVFNI